MNSSMRLAPSYSMEAILPTREYDLLWLLEVCEPYLTEPEKLE